MPTTVYRPLGCQTSLRILGQTDAEEEGSKTYLSEDLSQMLSLGSPEVAGAL